MLLTSAKSYVAHKNSDDPHYITTKYLMTQTVFFSFIKSIITPQTSNSVCVTVRLAVLCCYSLTMHQRITYAHCTTHIICVPQSASQKYTHTTAA